MATKIQVGAGQVVGSPGSSYGTAVSVTLGASATALIPYGWWMVMTDANTSVEWSYNAFGTAQLYAGYTTTNVLFSDGFNFRIHASGSGGTATRTQILQGA